MFSKNYEEFQIDELFRYGNLLCRFTAVYFLHALCVFHRLGLDKSYHEPKHNVGSRAWTRMIGNPPVTLAAGHGWQRDQSESKFAKVTRGTGESMSSVKNQFDRNRLQSKQTWMKQSPLLVRSAGTKNPPLIYRFVSSKQTSWALQSPTTTTTSVEHLPWTNRENFRQRSSSASRELRLAGSDTDVTTKQQSFSRLLSTRKFLFPIYPILLGVYESDGNPCDCRQVLTLSYYPQSNRLVKIVV